IKSYSERDRFGPQPEQLADAAPLVPGRGTPRAVRFLTPTAAAGSIRQPPLERPLAPHALHRSQPLVTLAAARTPSRRVEAAQGRHEGAVWSTLPLPAEPQPASLRT